MGCCMSVSNISLNMFSQVLVWQQKNIDFRGCTSAWFVDSVLSCKGCVPLPVLCFTKHLLDHKCTFLRIHTERLKLALTPKEPQWPSPNVSYLSRTVRCPEKRCKSVTLLVASRHVLWGPIWTSVPSTAALHPTRCLHRAHTGLVQSSLLLISNNSFLQGA